MLSSSEMWVVTETTGRHHWIFEILKLLKWLSANTAKSNT